MASASGLAKAVKQAFERSEAAERGLAIDGDTGDIASRLASGSFYTPADVVDHFWREYVGFHRIADLAEFRSHLRDTTFVEPSVGAGVFLFGLMKLALSMGCDFGDLTRLKFVAVDINHHAVDFVARQVERLELETGIRFEGLELVCSDFLDGAFTPAGRLSFVGNPPWARNNPSSRWKNLYADFIERMLDVPTSRRSMSLIVPISIAFSRDYSALRRRLLQHRAVRMESFDNIPDCLFKVGKPGNVNTNKANSQRCCILSVSDSGPAIRQSTAMQRWARGDREVFLKSSPAYIDFNGYAFDGQMPRPSKPWIMEYLKSYGDDVTIGDLCGIGPHRLVVAGVARNFIGLREPQGEDPGVVSLNFQSEVHFAWALQIVGSPVFYEYWRTLGDGFHVTRSDVTRFPISPRLLSVCNSGADRALSLWRQRSEFVRSKLNAGRVIQSYDFRTQFANLLGAVEPSIAEAEIQQFGLPAYQSRLPGLTIPAE